MCSEIGTCLTLSLIDVVAEALICRIDDIKQEVLLRGEPELGDIRVRLLRRVACRSKALSPSTPWHGTIRGK